jgi:hypothetical protein
MLPQFSPSSHGTSLSMMACTHGHVQQSAHAVLDSRAPCHYMERRQFRRRGRNTDKSRRHVDEVMRQVRVRAQTTDARDDAYGAGTPNQLPEHKPCSNGQDACDNWVTGHSRPRIMCRWRLTQMMMMMAAYLRLTWLTSPAMMRITHLNSIRRGKNVQNGLTIPMNTHAPPKPSHQGMHGRESLTQ